MIPCNELRIGNYFLLDGQLHRVSMLNGTRHGDTMVGYEDESDQHPHTCTPAQLQPVPLDETLLQQAGFRYHPYFQFWQRVTNESGVLSEMDIDSDYNVIDFMRRPIVKGISSLHQLQNIFYSLKGKELDVAWEKKV
jgi:hypothetical protein